jgi:hypothetical protein
MPRCYTEQGPQVDQDQFTLLEYRSLIGAAAMICDCPSKNCMNRGSKKRPQALAQGPNRLPVADRLSYSFTVTVFTSV